MKIGILTEIINFHSGSRAPLEIARHLSLIGNDVTIYAYNHMLDKTALKSLKMDNVKVKLIQRPKTKFFSKQLAISKLYRLLKADSPDIMTFSGTPPFFIAAKLTGIPIVRIYQGVQFDALLENILPNLKPTILQNLLNKLANIAIFIIDFSSFRLSNGVVCISKYAQDEGKHLYRRQADVVIYHGTTPLKSSKILKKKDQTSTNLVSVSRITPYKGFHKIIEALNKVKTDKKIKLTIVGSQPKKAYVKYLKKIGKEKLTIVTNPKDAKLAEIYKNSDIYVSADRYLYFGLPIYEAGVFSLPTVSLNLAAAAEIVKHTKSGYIANSQQEFTKYLEILINNPSLRIKMGKWAKDLAANEFTWQKTAKEYQSFFTSLLGKR